ncbi:unnamed protein product [Ilex paraguariensis]|uniref:Uncharacterized protein n=1 Tax=Ilex paraguariensis TaxID=185542 RepID=A0ABC8QT88_9AQUA
MPAKNSTGKEIFPSRALDAFLPGACASSIYLMDGLSGGILIQTLADASHDRHSLSAPQIIFNVFGFGLTVITTVIVTTYAKSRLKELQKDEELLLQGILIQTLADASHDRHSLSAPQIIFNVFGFGLTVITTVIVTTYAKSRLKELQKDEELLLQ